MSDDPSATARASYNRMSKVYGILSDSSEKRFIHEAIDDLLKPQPGEVILEPGFGSGQVLVAIAEAVGDQGRVQGIDVSDGMVKHATSRLRKHGLLDRVDLQRGDAAAMPYTTDTFDAVFMSFTLELFSDQAGQAVLSEVRRVLKPTGRICVACMSNKGGVASMEKLYEWSHSRFPAFVDCRPIDGAEWLTVAGFRVDVRRQLSMWGLAVDLLLAHCPD